MTEGIIFAIGFVLFVVTTTATLLFGYLQFHRIYREDRLTDQSSFAVDVADSGTEVQVPGDPVAFTVRQTQVVPVR